MNDNSADFAAEIYYKREQFDLPACAGRKPRGRCPVCYERKYLTGDGRIKQHKPPGRYSSQRVWCPGTLKEPTEYKTAQQEENARKG
jgi:hypothetical protein